MHEVYSVFHDIKFDPFLIAILWQQYRKATVQGH